MTLSGSRSELDGRFARELMVIAEFDDVALALV